MTRSGGICRLAAGSCSCTDSAKYYLPRFRPPACISGWRRRQNSSLELGRTRSVCPAVLLCSSTSVAAVAIPYTGGVLVHEPANSAAIRG